MSARKVQGVAANCWYHLLPSKNVTRMSGSILLGSGSIGEQHDERLDGAGPLLDCRKQDEAVEQLVAASFEPP
jgi:hypothetical protein